MAQVTRWTANPTSARIRVTWVERLWSSVADRGRSLRRGASTPGVRYRPTAPGSWRPPFCRNAARPPAPRWRGSCTRRCASWSPRIARFYRFLAQSFLPAEERLRAAAEAYLADPARARRAACRSRRAARQELLRRMNMAPGGTAALVACARSCSAHCATSPALKPLDSDLRHLLGSWFNRGFLELRRIDWQTPAAVLEKLIAYEAVHEIQGWDDLRRRLAPDRRCFGFFHPALAGRAADLRRGGAHDGLGHRRPAAAGRATKTSGRARAGEGADTAIFYSISNCQDGLRGVSFGNFLIKQVVEELKAELPRLVRFSTLSPVPGFRRWLNKRLAEWEMPPISWSRMN